MSFFKFLLRDIDDCQRIADKRLCAAEDKFKEVHGEYHEVCVDVSKKIKRADTATQLARQVLRTSSLL